MKKFAQIMFSVCTLVASFAGAAFAGNGPPTSVPEPGTFVLLGLGAAGVVLYKKFKK